MENVEICIKCERRFLLFGRKEMKDFCWECYYQHLSASKSGIDLEKFKAVTIPVSECCESKIEETSIPVDGKIMKVFLCEKCWKICKRKWINY